MKVNSTKKYSIVWFSLILSILMSPLVLGADFDASLEEKKIIFTTEFTNTGLLDLKIGAGSSAGNTTSSDSSTSFGVQLNLESDCEECDGMSGEITGAVIETRMYSKAYDINIEAILNSGKVFGNYVVGGSSFLSVIDSPVSIEEYTDTTSSSTGNGSFSSTTVKEYYENRADEVWTFVMDGGYAGFFTSMTEDGASGGIFEGAE